jgi:hypothetical protein
LDRLQVRRRGFGRWEVRPAPEDRARVAALELGAVVTLTLGESQLAAIQALRRELGIEGEEGKTELGGQLVIVIEARPLLGPAAEAVQHERGFVRGVLNALGLGVGVRI